jgi:hypothetical protein
VMIGLDAYHEIRADPNNFLASPGHDAEQAELVSEAPGYEVRRSSHRRHNGDSDGDRRSA